jgi:two-component system, OmpR family, phosphate regulon sensor histidine kinase PhoR
MLKRILLLFTIVMVVGVLITSTLNMYQMRQNYLQTVEEKLQSNTQLVEAFLEEHRGLDLDALVDDLGKRIDARITVIDQDGKVNGDSEVDWTTLENHSTRPEIVEALTLGQGTAIRYSKSVGNDLFYFAKASISNGGTTVIRLSVSLEEISLFNALLFQQSAISMLVGLVTALIIGFRFSSQLVQPLKELIVVSKRISEGAFGQKVYLSSKDEVGELAATFNVMSEALKDNVQNFNDRHMKLQAILNSMINPVITLDNNRKVLFYNPEAEKVFGFGNKTIEGRTFIEVIRQNMLDEQIRDLIIDGNQVVSEIEIYEPSYRILKVYSNPIELQSDAIQRFGVVMLFDDITEMRKLERMRKDFVANVSHELKTPLTSIRGFVETLESGAVEDPGVRDRFLHIIAFETDRLTSIVEDLLKLSDIENENSNIGTEIFDVSQPTQEVMEFLRDLATKHKVILNCILPEYKVFVQGKLIWFKQMLINLVDNGIKYNVENGFVALNLKVEGNVLKLTVRDSGQGIEEEHLDRLFERFYRVDKARSRSVGGTGLGLSIVKHIVIQFGGKITVTSTPKEGSTFIVELPIVRIES